MMSHSPFDGSLLVFLPEMRFACRDAAPIPVFSTTGPQQALVVLWAVGYSKVKQVVLQVCEVRFVRLGGELPCCVSPVSFKASGNPADVPADKHK